MLKKNISFMITAQILTHSLANFYCLYVDSHKFLICVMRHQVRADDSTVCDRRKQRTSLFYASVLLQAINFVIKLSRQSAYPLGHRLVDPATLIMV